MAIGIINKITQKITKTNTGRKQRSKKRTIRGQWALGRSESNWHFKHAWVFAFTRAWNDKITIYKHLKTYHTSNHGDNFRYMRNHQKLKLQTLNDNGKCGIYTLSQNNHR